MHVSMYTLPIRHHPMCIVEQNTAFETHTRSHINHLSFYYYSLLLHFKYDPPVASESDCALSGNVFASQLGYGWRIGDFSSEIVT